MSNIDLNDLFFFETNDLTTMDKRWDIVNKFLIENRFIDTYVVRESNLTKLSNREYLLVNILVILITPKSIWHNHDNDIIWFNINEMTKLEKWVSDITKTNFKMKNVNSHSHIETKIKLNDENNVNDLKKFLEKPNTFLITGDDEPIYKLKDYAEDKQYLTSKWIKKQIYSYDEIKKWYEKCIEWLPTQNRE
jgi:hypothetical protein